MSIDTDPVDDSFGSLEASTRQNSARRDDSHLPLAVADTAPDFELTADTWGKDASTYKLSDALGEGGVVLQFFPLPFTGTCRRRCAASATTSRRTALRA